MPLREGSRLRGHLALKNDELKTSGAGGNYLSHGSVSDVLIKGTEGAAVEPRRTPMKAPRRPQGGQRDTSGMGHVEYVVFSKQNQGSKPKVTIFSM